MAIVIRHGSNGAMKSAAAVDRYLVPAIKEGRTVVTNLRGFNLERCYEVFPDLSEDLEVIFVDTEYREGKNKMARWFHWAPIGAILVFDEASTLFPKSWREKDIVALDYPGGLDKATEDGRPPNWVTAWEMHRHFNWDIVLTTPNIKNIRDDIRNTTEMAYRQRSLGKVASEKFRMFKEVQHDATKNGFTHSDAISVGTQRLSRDSFRLYDSTKTGVAQESNAGKSLLADPKVLLLGLFAVVSISFVACTGGPSITNQETETGDVVPIEDERPRDEVAIPNSDPSASRVRSGPVDYQQSGRDAGIADPLAQNDLRLLGTFDGESQILVTGGNSAKTIMTPKTLSKLGYAYFPVSPCVGRLEYKGRSRVVLCGSEKEKTEQSKTPGSDNA